MGKRLLDLSLFVIASLLLGIPFFIIYLLVKITSPGPAIHWSKRVGRKNTLFLMPKFRTMSLSTPQVATHLLTDSENYFTPIGKLLRQTSLDEIPQLWSVLRGDMSFVGPRPALYNQDDLVELRTTSKIDDLVPGITGWAQINGRDSLTIPEKVKLDLYYSQNKSLLLDIKILFLTIFNVFFQKNISH